MNLHSKKISLMIIATGLSTMFVLLLATEVLFDQSLLSASLLLPILILVLHGVALGYTILKFTKYSLLVSGGVFVICLGLTIVMFLMKHSVGFYLIEKAEADTIINANDDDAKINTVKAYTEKKSTSVLFYEIGKSSNTGKAVDEKKISETCKNFINQVRDKCKSNKNPKVPVIVKLDAPSDFEISFDENLKKYCKMLQSIFYSKFSKNLVILIPINDINDLGKNGFKRSTENKLLTSNP